MDEEKIVPKRGAPPDLSLRYTLSVLCHELDLLTKRVEELEKRCKNDKK